MRTLITLLTNVPVLALCLVTLGACAMDAKSDRFNGRLKIRGLDTVYEGRDISKVPSQPLNPAE